MGFRVPKGCERLEAPFSNFVVTKTLKHQKMVGQQWRVDGAAPKAKNMVSLFEFFLSPDGAFEDINR